MASTLPILPDDKLRPLRAGYAEAINARRRATLLGLVVVVILSLAAAWQAEVAPIKFVREFWRFTNYLNELVPPLRLSHFAEDMNEWFWGIRRWLRLLTETIFMAYVGTLLGGLGAFVMCFLAAANLTPVAWQRGAARRFLEFCRTVPEVVYALIFVAAFGLGAWPGVLAIAIHTCGALGKQFAEVVENIDMKPVEGIASTGADRLEVIRFAVVPQVLSNMLSYGLLRFEINVRGAGILGVVGAGGIGHDLMIAIRQFHYTDISALLVLIILTVVLVDLLAERLRHRLIGQEGH